MAASPERVSNIKNRYAVEAIRFSLWAAPGLILFLPWHGFRGFGPHGHGDIESLVVDAPSPGSNFEDRRVPLGNSPRLRYAGRYRNMAFDVGTGQRWSADQKRGEDNG